MRFIFTADWHLRPDKPRCRIDEDWVETQFKHVKRITTEADKHDLPLIIGGDVFHKSQVPDSIKNLLLSHILGLEVYAIAGQHDEPYHSFDNIKSSSWGVLFVTRSINVPTGFGKCAHYGTDFEGISTGLYFTHELIFKDEKAIPSHVKALTAQQALDKYPDAKWVFSGDNHHGFHYEKDGRHVLMAGCLNRQAADMKDYTPVFWIVDIDKGTAEPIEVGDNVEMVTDEYLRDAEEKNERIVAFVESIKGAQSTSLDYLENVSRAISDMSAGIKNVVQELLEEVK